MKKSKNRSIYNHFSFYKKSKTNNNGITLIALVITILFRYDENIKCSNSKGFLQQPI